MPRLRSVMISGSFVRNNQTAFAAFPTSFFHQLHTVRLFGEPSGMSFISRLSQLAQFTLQLHDSSFHAEPVTSNISTFAVELGPEFSTSTVVGPTTAGGPTVAKVLDSLTLPLLETLELVSQHFPPVLLLWPHTQFLALAARSSFHTHLRSLQLFDCIITQTELIVCLSDLPLLESLTISDHESAADVSTYQPLVADSLLAHLTIRPEIPSLVPCLRALHCRSLLQFDDQVYLNFLLSRVKKGCVFETQLSWLSGHFRLLDPIVVVRLYELHLRGELIAVFEGTRGT
ncbi:hypothetical protein B0H17DRAFT_680018 [Mycena rosella]|uniref:Uncharacterized protein n=1 Tax=Mycena rosella TaxID=1033263 RepID=A0AAD7GGD8_MYCRO|nr:hypothetical protein B0H17DRAFT_680018 [Mycena rosella]